MNQMAPEDIQMQTQDALADAIGSGAFPARVMGSAEALLTRLQTTTRVTLLGRPGTGKSAIVNLLAGEDLIPDGIRLCTVQLIWGRKEKVTVTLRDGTTLSTAGAPDWAHLTDQSPVFIKIEAPLAALKKISLLEVVTSGSATEQARACKWAAKQTDIALWCTEGFDEDERAQWHNMPDRIKDHAILLRTHAEKLGDGRGDAVDQLRDRAADSFAHVIAVSGSEAAAARAASGGVDKMRLRSSGAVALISTILRQIENGRQSAIDHAEMLLHIYRDFTPPISTVKSRKFRFQPDDIANTDGLDDDLAQAMDTSIEPPTPIEDDIDEAPKAPTPEARDDLGPSIGGASYSFSVKTRRGQQNLRSEPAPIPALQPRPTAHPNTLVPSEITELPDFVDAFDFGHVEPAPAPRKVEPPKVSNSPTQIYRGLADQFRGAGKDLQTDGDHAPATIIMRCFDEISNAQTQVMLLPPDGSDTHASIAYQLQEAQDLVQLLSLENDQRGAVDAVSMLLQLKRAFQAAAS